MDETLLCVWLHNRLYMSTYKQTTHSPVWWLYMPKCIDMNLHPCMKCVSALYVEVWLFTALVSEAVQFSTPCVCCVLLRDTVVCYNFDWSSTIGNASAPRARSSSCIRTSTENRSTVNTVLFCFPHSEAFSTIDIASLCFFKKTERSKISILFCQLHCVCSHTDFSIKCFLILGVNSTFARTWRQWILL